MTTAPSRATTRILTGGGGEAYLKKASYREQNSISVFHKMLWSQNPIAFSARKAFGQAKKEWTETQTLRQTTAPSRAPRHPSTLGLLWPPKQPQETKPQPPDSFAQPSRRYQPLRRLVSDHNIESRFPYQHYHGIGIGSQP